jgi:sugar/nucleoside kinase (ribokinase family)
VPPPQGREEFRVNVVSIGEVLRDVVGQDEHLSTRYVRRAPEYPTGVVTVSLDSSGHPGYVIHRPAAYDFPWFTEEGIAELFSHPVDWIYFGTLLQMSPQGNRLTMRLLAPAKRRGDSTLSTCAPAAGNRV